ncbi:MAG: hypothetical protein IT362_10850 [Deltaproteobacteria bacterium]|nr:hypothetical protein [Deltaproteobacteria bacterium]
MIREGESSRAISRRQYAALIACLAVFGLLRLAASMGDFYLDEIWSFYFSRQISSPLDVFKLNHDNNHILNTLYLYMVGGEPFFFAGKPTFIPHRLFSVLSGIVSLFLVWKIASRQGRVEAFTALVLCGLSYPLVIYSSEARGYSPEIMFALASFLLVEASFAGKRSAAFYFWAFVPLAFLSHSSFIYIYAALFLWSALEEVKNNGVLTGARRLAFLHFVPVVFSVFYYLFFLKGMVYGGGEVSGAWSEVLMTASMFFGLPSGPSFGYGALALIFFVSIAGLVRLKKARPGQPVFFVLAIFIVPAAIIVLMKPEFLYFRYFLVCFPFLYLLAAYALSPLYNRPGSGRVVFFVLVAVFCVLNLKSDFDLLNYGRGSYSEALGYMVSETNGPEVIAAGDHDFRNKTVLGFYSVFFAGKRITYLGREEKSFAPDWFIAHSVDRAYRPPEFIFDSGSRFTLKRSYGFAGVSGWSWFVYKKDAQEIFP